MAGHGLTILSEKPRPNASPADQQAISLAVRWLSRMKWFALAMSVILLAAAPDARAQDTACTTTLQSQTVDGDLVVPNDASCLLSAVTVTGNVWVEPGASLDVDAATIGGSITAYQCSYVHLHGYSMIYVAGNVSIENCTGSSTDNNPLAFGSFFIQIGGNLTCDQNLMPCAPRYSSISGNVQITNNGGGPSQVYGNMIGGYLMCSGNAAVSAVPALPPNLPVQPNIVVGSAQGQCLGFTPQ